MPMKLGVVLVILLAAGAYYAYIKLVPNCAYCYDEKTAVCAPCQGTGRTHKTWLKRPDEVDYGASDVKNSVAVSCDVCGGTGRVPCPHCLKPAVTPSPP